MFDGLVFIVCAFLILGPWVVILYPYIDDSLGPVSHEEDDVDGA